MATAAAGGGGGSKEVLATSLVQEIIATVSAVRGGAGGAAAMEAAAPQLAQAMHQPQRKPQGAVLLHTRVVECRAMVSELLVAGGGGGGSSLQSLRVHLMFRGQMLASHSVEVGQPQQHQEGGPRFDMDCCFGLRAAPPATPAEWRDLLEVDQDTMLHVCLTRERMLVGQDGMDGDGRALGEGVAAAAAVAAVTEAGDELGVPVFARKRRRELLATASIDWRYGVSSADEVVSVELICASEDSLVGQPVGVVDLALRVSGIPPALLTTTTPETVEDLITDFQERAADRSQQVYWYCRRWWEQYREQLQAQHAIGHEQHQHRQPAGATGAHDNVDAFPGHRTVRIFAEDESGQHRFLSSFVRPLAPGRHLDSAYHAARFVSLIPFERQTSVGGERARRWHSLHSFLSRASGDVEEHAALLCSILLGFGLEAFVAVGTIKDRAAHGYRDHAWVVTFHGLEPSTSSVSDQHQQHHLAQRPARESTRVVFWESLTAQRFQVVPAVAEGEDGSGDQDTGEHGGGEAGAHSAGRGRHHFRSITSVFNHEYFFANNQPSESVSGCNFDLFNRMAWIPMDRKAFTKLDILRHFSDVALDRLPPYSAECGAAMAEAVEAEVRQLIQRRRKDEAGLSCVWDEQLSSLLQPALAAYESERITGVTYGGVEFLSGLRRCVPTHHGFKGYPACFCHCDAQTIMQSLVESPLASQIMDISAPHVRMALRCRVFAYPASTVSCWVMLAVRYEETGAAAAAATRQDR